MQRYGWQCDSAKMKLASSLGVILHYYTYMRYILIAKIIRLGKKTMSPVGA